MNIKFDREIFLNIRSTWRPRRIGAPFKFFICFPGKLQSHICKKKCDKNLVRDEVVYESYILMDFDMFSSFSDLPCTTFLWVQTRL